MNVEILGCAGGIGRASEACSGYLVSDGQTRILLDCGAGVVAKLQTRCPVKDLRHVILSHWHADHASDIAVLVHGFIIERKHDETLPSAHVYAPLREPDFSRIDVAQKGCCAHAITEQTALTIDNLNIDFLRTKHSVECYALRLRCRLTSRSLVYTADGALTDELVGFCRGADVVLCECSLFDADDRRADTHMSIRDVAELAIRACPHTLIVTHLPYFGDRSELVERVRVQTAGRWSGKLLCAQEFMQVDMDER